MVDLAGARDAACVFSTTVVAAADAGGQHRLTAREARAFG